MLTKNQVSAANSYNAGRISDGRLDVNTMPWPWDELTGDGFVWATVAFQQDQRLSVDGKLGPATEGAIRGEFGSQEPSVPPVVEVPDGQFSNAIIVDGKRIVLPEEFVKAGLSASNYLDDGEAHFKSGVRADDPVHFVLHETCGNTASGCVNTLNRKAKDSGYNYGVHLIMDPGGHISCHNDLVREQVVHANQCNKTSFGIEVVNPYAPSYVSKPDVFSKTIPAQWWTWCPDKNDRRYVLPTDAQMAAIRLLAPWLCEVTGVPFCFPTKNLNGGNRQINGWDASPKARPNPGVVAHRDFSSHADGRYMLLDLIDFSQGGME